MKRVFISIIFPASLLAILTASFLISPSVGALSLQEGVAAARGNGMPTDLFGAGGIITTIVNTMLFIAGVLSVVMLIVGGLRYTISGGNAATVSAAKNTILYAIVGLVIALLAYAAVNWILGTLSTGGMSGYSNV